MKKTFLTAKQICEKYPELFTEDRLYRLVREGVVPRGVWVRLGRRIYFDAEAFDAWLKAGGAGFENGWRRNPPTGGAAPNADQQQLPFPEQEPTERES